MKFIRNYIRRLIGEEIEKRYGKDTLSVPVMPNRNFRVMVCYIEDKKSDKK